MAISDVAAPYAKALLDLSVAQGSLRTVREQVEKVAALVAGSDELRVVFSNPTVTHAEQAGVLEVLTTKLALSRTTRNFLFLLADKRRLAALTAIVLEFQKLADAHLGVLRAEVTSSVQLTVTQMTRLKNTLAELTGKTVLVTNAVEPAHIGGIRVQVDGKVYDTTVRRRLDRLRQSILQDI